MRTNEKLCQSIGILLRAPKKPANGGIVVNRLIDLVVASPSFAIIHICVGGVGRSIVKMYATASFWDERYAQTNSDSQLGFDWYQDMSTLKPALLPYLKQDSSDFWILIPGCGSSKLGADLYDLGYHNITNIDISRVVIAQQTDRYSDRAEMEFSEMDVMNMEFLPDASNDLVIDKALLDALLCGGENITNVLTMLREVHRVLKPGGVYVCISHGPPEARLDYLNKQTGWSIETRVVPKPLVEGIVEEGVAKNHYMYVCTKQA